MSLGFNALNSINEYNKVFQEDMSRINADIQGQNDFNEIFNNINNQIENPTLNAGIAKFPFSAMFKISLRFTSI